MQLRSGKYTGETFDFAIFFNGIRSFSGLLNTDDDALKLQLCYTIEHQTIVGEVGSDQATTEENGNKNKYIDYSKAKNVEKEMSASVKRG